MFAQIAVTLPLPLLTYKIPADQDLSVGSAVKVRVRKKIYDGIIFEIKEKIEKTDYEIKEIEEISQDYPLLSPHLLKLIEWASQYYHHPIGDVLQTFLPPNPAPLKKEFFRATEEGILFLKSAGSRAKKQNELLKKIIDEKDGVASTPEIRATLTALLKKNLIEKFYVSNEEIPDYCMGEKRGEIPNLTLHQANALAEIRKSIEQNDFTPFLLEGITGSGKTEVYLHAAEEALLRGKSVLIIVPEISLTPQLVSRFKNRLAYPIALLHSSITDKERSRQWHLLNAGKLRVCIGARSAILSPIENLGLIIVDEEHDSALKQEDHLRYNARDMAILRAKFSKATVVLGSATPSLETYHHARTGKYRHLILPDRATGQILPTVTVIDQAKEKKDQLITAPLKRAIEDSLNKNEQVMLLLNRRGFSSFLLCKNCGHVPQCPNCSVSLTNYASSKRMKCHYCGHTESIPANCQNCEGGEWLAGTQGTEALEQEVKNTFPARTILRMDRESMEKKGSLEQALLLIEKREVDIIVGTQMIAKGHDFPNISLVGVLNADTSFNLPDFRSPERSFQLFTQMAGRAGRGNIPGRVFIQTFNPKHPSILHTLSHNYRDFAEEELGTRREFGYPPFLRLARILLVSTDSRLAEKTSENVAQFLAAAQKNHKNIEVIGPAPAVLSKVQNRYRWNILLKSSSAPALHALIQTLLDQFKPKLDRKVMLQVDVDPLSLM